MRFIAILLLALLTAGVSAAQERRQATVYKSPLCGCCGEYVKILRQNGYQVTVVDAEDHSAIKRRYGITSALEGCHTTVVGGYAVEGHVPLKMIDRLLTEKPAIRGIALPGMPDGSPGMSGRKTEPFVVFEIGDGRPKVYDID